MLSVILAGTKGNKEKKKKGEWRQDYAWTRTRDVNPSHRKTPAIKFIFLLVVWVCVGVFCIGSNLVVVAKCISTMLGCHPMLLRKPRERRDPLLGSSGQSRSCIDPMILIPFTPLSLGYLSSNCQFSQCSNLTISYLLNSLKSSLLF